MNNEDRVDMALTAIADQRWSGPEHDERIEQLIREVQQMKQANGKKFSMGMLVAVGIAGVVGGGAVAGVVTQRIMAQRAILTTEDGTQYEVMLSPTTEGAAGSFITDDGTVYGVDMVQDGDQKEVTVDVSGEGAGGTSTLTVESDDED